MMGSLSLITEDDTKAAKKYFKNYFIKLAFMNELSIQKSIVIQYLLAF